MIFRAAEALKQCGPLVTLQVLKDAANRQGLSALLSKPSENLQQQSTVQLARFPATSNPSLMSHQSVPLSSSSIALKSASSHERLLTHHNGHQHQQHFATLAHPTHHHHHHHHPIQQPQPMPQTRPPMVNPSSSYEFVYNAKSVPVHSSHLPQRHNPIETNHRSIQPARSAQILIDEETHEDYFPDHHSHQHQSNPNLFHSNPLQYPTTNNRNQTFDLPKRIYDHDHQFENGYEHDQPINGEDDEDDEEEEEEELQPTNFVRTASERQSFGDRNLVNAPPLLYREDVPPPPPISNGTHHPMRTINHTQSAIGPTIAPKPPPKPMMSTLGLIKQTNDSDLNSRLSKVSLSSSSSDHLSSSIR